MTNEIMHDGRRYEKGRGFYVGYFDLEDIRSGVDKEEIRKVKEETGLRYTNTKIVKRNGVETALQVWVCNFEDFKV